MPTYEYLCDCGYTETAMDKMMGLKIKQCPICRQPKLHRLIGAGGGINFSTGLTDLSGDKIWFPKDGKPYFDQGLRQTFHTPQEKKAFMDKHKIISAGSDDINRRKKENVSKELVEIDKKKAKARKKMEQDMVRK